jgi:rhodanese-related sulfurtransferase
MDLLGVNRAAELGAAQHRSVRRLADLAGADAALYPTHGFGSFCATGPKSSAKTSTIGAELAGNHALTEPDVRKFVASLLAGLTAYPAYYAHMGSANLAGPGPPDLSMPAPLRPDDLRKRLGAGEWVIDLRNRVAFASDHLTGTSSFEYGRGGSFTSYVGWLVPRETPITLVGGAGDIERAIRDLSRIGVEATAIALGEHPAEIGPGLAVSTYPRVDWPTVLTQRTGTDVLLDVRRTEEYAEAHLAGAINLPIHAVLEGMAHLPRSGRILSYCETGYRSGIAASLLDRARIDVVHVDDVFASAKRAGAPIVHADSSRPAG